MNLKAELERRITAALAACGAPTGSPAMVASAARAARRPPVWAELGDYQANGVMPAAKAMGAKPGELAEKVLAQLGRGGAGDLSDLAEPPTVAGPGFINIRLKADWLGRQLTAAGGDEHLCAERAGKKDRQTVVVDYSGPNLAKEMHVGHLRSTIIGDALARTLKFLGHEVIRQNHVGDWGTQFGMLTAYLDERKAEIAGDTEKIRGVARINDLEAFYTEAKTLFDADETFAERAREYVVKLQAGDPVVRERWEEFTRLSLDHCADIFHRLGLEWAEVRGESAYNADLPNVVEDLRKGGLLTESQRAQCVFLPEFKDKDGNELPLIVQKSDEGYLYATTDLAAIRHRVRKLHASRILYVTDSRQALHFRQVFAVARAAKFAPPKVSLEHVAFGTMLGADGRPFRTREGGTVKLMDLLNEAEQRAFELVSAKNPDLDEDHRKKIAHVVGIGAVKYADLAQNRTSDCVFSWDKMLSLDGNTAPYMQYAYARIRSIFRKRFPNGQGAPKAGAIHVADPAERALALRLARFAETVAAVADQCLPHILCAYLYDLAGAFMGFYETCPVLQADGPTRASRLALCDLTARTIRTGLDLLGIQTLEQM